MKKEHPLEAFVIKDEELVCKLGDIVKLIAEFESREHYMDQPPGPITFTEAAGQLYRVEDRKGAGWDLIRISGDGPDNIRMLNGDFLDYFEIVK